MKSKIGFFLSSLLCLSSGCAAESPHIASEAMRLSTVQIAALRSKALRGDAIAANELAEYYGVYVADDALSEFWIRVAAENGNCESQKEIVYRISSQSSKHKNQVGYWKERAKDANCVIE